MFELEVDYECVRELLIEMAEEFDACGYPKVLEDFEGTGRIGRAVQKPRDEDAIRVIHVYLKGIGKELLAEEASLVQKLKQAPQLKNNPQFKDACRCVLEAKKYLEETFQSLKKCFREPPVSPKGVAKKPSAILPPQPRKALPPAAKLQSVR